MTATLSVSVALHLLGAWILGSFVEQKAQAALTPAPLAFEVVAPLAPDTPEPVVEAEVEPPPPPAPVMVRRTRKALRRAPRPEEPTPKQPEPSDEELGEPDATPQEAPVVAMEEPAITAADGVAVATGAGAEQGRAASSGDDLVNRSGSADGEGSAPVVDLRALAKAWTDRVNKVLRREVRSHYPIAARRMRQQGVVVVQLRVAGSGAIESAELLRSSSHARLDRAALELLRALATLPEPPEALWPYLEQTPVKIPINFRLD